MKIYELGKDNAPTLMLLPGTFCDWKGNFENVLHLLEKDFKILCVSYTGFEKTEKDNFISMTDEVENSDLVTLLPSKIDSINTEIHIFYALNMGKKYLGRYKKYFAKPIIHEHKYNHEELLLLSP